MGEFAQWLPWLVGIVIAFVVLRFIAGLVVRLLTIAVLLLVVYLVWRFFTGA